MNFSKKIYRKRILITGAEGFIGGHLIRFLLNYDCRIYALFYRRSQKNIIGKLFWFKCDIRNKKKLSVIVNRIKPDYIIHLAAFIEKSENKERIKTMMDTNFLGTFNLLEALRNIHFSKLVFLGSGEEYRYCLPPFKESQEADFSSPYGLSKSLGVRLNLLYNRVFSYPIIILRPSVVYGPNQQGKMFIPSLLKSIKENKSFSINGGEQTRDFVYIDDVVRAIILSATKDISGEIINIGRGESIKIIKAINIAKKVFASDIDVIANPYGKNEIMSYSFNIEKAEKLLGWKPKCSLESGLRKIRVIQKKKGN